MYNNRIVKQLQIRSTAMFDCAKLLTYSQGDPISETGQPIETVLFPESVMISAVTRLTDGSRIETAMVGYNGAIGASALFGAKTHTFESFVQLAGTAWVVPAKDLIELAEEDVTLAPIMFDTELLLSAEARQTAACNARHPIGQRLATWLLRAHDATGLSAFYSTQEFIAEMLGVQRPSVSMLASELQAQGLIQYRRGRIEILNLDGLESIACECYADLRRTRELIFRDRRETGQRSQSRHLEPT
jgi:CRP-like cAMP-binding protein